MRPRDADVECVQRAERRLESADQLSSTDEVLRFDRQSPVRALFEVALELTRDAPGVREREVAGALTLRKSGEELDLAQQTYCRDRPRRADEALHAPAQGLVPVEGAEHTRIEVDQ